jgi:PAS domain S-box-containing protein
MNAHGDQEDYYGLLQSLPFAVFVLNGADGMKMMNRAAEALLRDLNPGVSLSREALGVEPYSPEEQKHGKLIFPWSNQQILNFRMSPDNNHDHEIRFKSQRFEATFSKIDSMACDDVVIAVKEEFRAAGGYDNGLFSENVWQDTFDALPDLITILDTDHRILKANKAFAEKFGLSVAEIEGQFCYRLVHKLDCPPSFCPHVRLMADHLECSTEVSGSDLGGIYKISCSPIYASDGALHGSVHVARDLTGLKKAEQALVNNERLNAVAELATGVAHNFNNLLQIILGNAGIALAGLETGDYREVASCLEEILNGSHYGAETVKKLQSFVRLRNDTKDSQAQVFDLSNTIRQAIEISRVWWKAAAEKKGASIQLCHNLQSGCNIKGHEYELFDVVLNLIKNAVEALPQGGNIEIGSKAESGSVGFFIKDDGVGISPEHQQRILEPFFTTKGFQNTGMGLSSSYGIVTAHQGRMSIESKEGEGSVFRITLPLASSEPGIRAEMDQRERHSALRILIVDDMTPIVNMLAQGFGKCGHKVKTAGSGKEALEIISQIELDAIVCDLGMPEMNGWEVGRRVKLFYEDYGIPRPTFVILTGWGGQLGDEVQLPDCGVDAILEKPVEAEEILATIHGLRNRRSAAV